ncbi:hypothetical protein SAMN05216249_104137 [Acetitomaculum ruminis DSM 5522]|uniref:HEAT repeat-containing protein n=1 Tax=Acetitomaculum ruminis DSM 5522 TaxID=1120918 RepID=A0A1I0WKP1_9FIRM|nr:hypothetical protein [Acetitomaculum ruminis]SFA89322.1 hypothetical protein SAMN05216249_104137 [Acetitomaculum ruminis DSM 5522]
MNGLNLLDNDNKLKDNCLFIWQFKEEDLKDMCKIFDAYRLDVITENSKKHLQVDINKIENRMLKEGFNPVECMLYASKIINLRLSNDNNMIEILAKEIFNICKFHEKDTTDILIHIINKWSWIPQLKVVIEVCGFLGENDLLMDLILEKFAKSKDLKSHVFNAIMKVKTQKNLERALKIISNIGTNEEDRLIVKKFNGEIRDFRKFSKVLLFLTEYKKTRPMSKAGQNAINQLLLDNGVVRVNVGDMDYMRSLAEKSVNDEEAFIEFMTFCYKKFDEEACYLSRFSRPEAGEFLRTILANISKLKKRTYNNAVISLGILGSKGYKEAESIISDLYVPGLELNNYPVLVALMILMDGESMEEIIDFFVEKKEYNLSDLFFLLKMADFNSKHEVLKEFQRRLYLRYIKLISTEDRQGIIKMTKNLQMFWSREISYLIPVNLLRYICEILKVYSKDSNVFPLEVSVVISMMDIVSHNWNALVEDTVFSIYKNSDDIKVVQRSKSILLSKEIMAPN